MLLRRLSGLIYALVLFALLLSKRAHAEKTLLKADDWEVYTDGRVSAFVGYVHGDGYPQSRYDANGVQLWDIAGGGLNAIAEREPVAEGSAQLTQGTIKRWRVRTGFIGNIVAVGVRAKIDETNKAIGYVQFWSYIESQQQRKGTPNPVDVRQGYLKLEGTWGSLLGGRSRTLFSRGATDINVAYAHRYGVGYPGAAVDSYGPTAGQIGFGVLGSGFASGFVYATPVLAGLQLSVGAFDPIALQGAWDRTDLLRPEVELTFEQSFGATSKLILFGNGAYQNLYKRDSSESTAAAGFGYGGRVELGPVRLGVAGHYGKGLGLNYALEPSDATLDFSGALRKFDGYYVQSQVVLGDFDLSAGAGITRVFLGSNDTTRDPAGNLPAHSVVKSQRGINAGIVYHWRPFLHFDIDYFRADFAWFYGEKQGINVLNAGMTLTW